MGMIIKFKVKGSTHIHKRSLEVNKGQMGVKNQNVKKVNTMGMIIKFKVKGQGQGQGHYYYCYSPIAHSCIPYLERFLLTLLTFITLEFLHFYETLSL